LKRSAIKAKSKARRPLLRALRLATIALLCLVTIAFLYLVLSGRSTPLEPWHTEKLTEEFTVAKVEKVRTFEDYMRLEDRLFNQLEKKVYARVDSGPDHALSRYSAGSATDPQKKTPNWNRSFELTAEAPLGGVLLLHGMSDSPYSLRALAETLRQRGYWVIGLRLPGHGTAPSGLKYITMYDMTAAVRLAMARLASKLGKKPIHVVGFSTGGALALDYALKAIEGSASPAPASLVLISPAIRVHPVAALAKSLNSLSIVPGLERLAWQQILPESDPFKYSSFATNASDVVHRLTRSVDSRIAAWVRSGPDKRLPPILVFQSTVDSTVTTEAVIDRLLALLPPRRNELVLFDINRSAVKSMLLTSNPGPLTNRLMTDETLPFAVTFVGNENPDTSKVVIRRKAPFSTAASDTEKLNLAWPKGVISLSHVALPIPPDDPLYGQLPPDSKDTLLLGEAVFQGERGLLRLSGDSLQRLKYNPFYKVVENRVLEWFDKVGKQTMRPLPDSESVR
jgi:alpha-beta hydrolase superfamily lysophospholipase